jgi:hypothetical protein
MSIDDFFERTIKTISDFETEGGTLKVPGDGDQTQFSNWVMHNIVNFRTQFMVMKSKSFAMWMMMSKMYDLLSDDDRKVVEEHFNSNLKVLEEKYEEARKEAAKPKVATPSSRIITP